MKTATLLKLAGAKIPDTINFVDFLCVLYGVPIDTYQPEFIIEPLAQIIGETRYYGGRIVTQYTEFELQPITVLLATTQLYQAYHTFFRHFRRSKTPFDVVDVLIEKLFADFVKEFNKHNLSQLMGVPLMSVRIEEQNEVILVYATHEEKVNTISCVSWADYLKTSGKITKTEYLKIMAYREKKEKPRGFKTFTPYTQKYEN